MGMFNDFAGIFGLNSINQDFNYDVAQSSPFSYDTSGYDAATGSYGTSGQSQGYMDQLSNQAGFGMDMAQSTFGQAQQFFDPSSNYYQQQRGYMQEATSGQMANLSNQQNQQLAQRGMGGGGLGALLGSSNAGAVGESVRQGMMGVQAQGLQAGTGLLGAANQSLGMATGAAGAGGTLAGAEAQRGQTQALANQSAQNTASQFGANWANTANQEYANQQYGSSQFNAQAQNDYSQYELTSAYNQQLGDRTNRAGFFNNLIGAAATAYNPLASDENIKKDIVKVGKSEDGYNIYEFKYIGDDTKYRGVIAQEILLKKPEAVVQRNGILGVYYNQIDVDFVIA
tara:strand:- start:34212 stop:35234 length:1023 start_codon:yes stop_codon:yes gene_type:complete